MLPYQTRVRVNVNILNLEKNDLKAENFFAFCDAIIAYHYLSRNLKFVSQLKTVN